jgi:dolichol-phosphate mannosyltransferase
MTLLTIGLPVKNENENLAQLRLRLETLLATLETLGLNFEILVNDNMSTDGSTDTLKTWSLSDERVKVKTLTSPLNFQETVQDLMKRSKGDAFVLLQTDLQDPPEVISEFVKLWLSGFKVVAGVIEKRKESFIQNLARRAFYKVLDSVSDDNIIRGFQDFYLIDNEVVTELIRLPSEGLFLRGHISSRFSRLAEVKYQRGVRAGGESKFNFTQKYSLGMSGLLLFGTKFVRRLSIFSFMVFLTSSIAIFFVLVLYVAGYRAPIQGWVSLGLLLLLIIAFLGMTVGITLEYLIRIYRILIIGRRE